MKRCRAASGGLPTKMSVTVDTTSPWAAGGTVPRGDAIKGSPYPPCHKRAIHKGLGRSPRGAVTSATSDQSWSEAASALLCKQEISRTSTGFRDVRARQRRSRRQGRSSSLRCRALHLDPARSTYPGDWLRVPDVASTEGEVPFPLDPRPWRTKRDAAMPCWPRSIRSSLAVDHARESARRHA